MKLVGASNWFVRVPFMAEGLVQGLIGAGFAVGVVVALKVGLRRLVRQPDRVLPGLLRDQRRRDPRRAARAPPGHPDRPGRLGHRPPPLPPGLTPPDSRLAGSRRVPRKAGERGAPVGPCCCCDQCCLAWASPCGPACALASPRLRRSSPRPRGADGAGGAGHGRSRGRRAAAAPAADPEAGSQESRRARPARPGIRAGKAVDRRQGRRARRPGDGGPGQARAARGRVGAARRRVRRPRGELDAKQTELDAAQASSQVSAAEMYRSARRGASYDDVLAVAARRRSSQQDKYLDHVSGPARRASSSASTELRDELEAQRKSVAARRPRPTQAAADAQAERGPGRSASRRRSSRRARRLPQQEADRGERGRVDQVRRRSTRRELASMQASSDSIAARPARARRRGRARPAAARSVPCRGRS